jgi:TAT (twin-arginine translocation) pathway signal sequence
MALGRATLANRVAAVGQMAAGGQPDLSHTERFRPSRRDFLKVAGIGGAAIGLSGLGIAAWRTSAQGVFAAGSGPAYAA